MPKETLGREPTRDQRELSPEEVLGRRTGDGPFRFEGGPAGCLLIHGFTGSPPEMRLLGDYLHSRGITVAAPLHPAGAIGAGFPGQVADRAGNDGDAMAALRQIARQLMVACAASFIKGYKSLVDE